MCTPKKKKEESISACVWEGIERSNQVIQLHNKKQ